MVLEYFEKKVIKISPYFEFDCISINKFYANFHGGWPVFFISPPTTMMKYDRQINELL